VGVQFWLKRSLIQGNCPVCTTPLTGIKDATTQCPNCGTVLTTTANSFQRQAEEGTIDITAMDVVDITADTLTLDTSPTLPEPDQDLT
jgi:uncharacterized Zn finger protein (UPF0148 family)